MKRVRFLAVAALLSMSALGSTAVIIPPAAEAASGYPYANSAVGKKDRWGFLTRYCTSYVAYRLDKRGFNFSNHYKGESWGDAKTWDNAAKKAGLTVNKTPKVGAVAVWGSNMGGGAGHVAVVSKISGGKITVQEYNVRVSFGYGERVIGSIKPESYIHF
ncbi:CHAP domain-containing protein [Allokutzneria sp. A3M-2-11 16]|uniref:CHAP domain-containing protein n=1 Tax=Allokutzneria sp. A3M-2-11 16 TaxID=2962043 RepID=UPI0020B7FEA4|nr:CHAP domain-containing protein [Allokutzneria sp. A3M-2-11 16]MCP3798974.1 CHAP domain-containing protein [Allokutzneria sp. A3M-2-11 16]